MNRFPRSFFAFGLLLLISGLAEAGEFSNAKLSLHVQPFVAKTSTLCDSAAPLDLACSQHNVSGPVKTPVHVYLTIARVDPGIGIAGTTLGVTYGRELKVLGWNLCGDLEFLDGPWPESNSGVRILWASQSNCQRDVVPGKEEEGVHAVAGAFYIYAYAPGDLVLTMNTYRGVIPPELKIMDCSNNTPDLDPEKVPSVRFSESGAEPGVSPCALDPVPVEPTSWGRIKHLSDDR